MLSNDDFPFRNNPEAVREVLPSPAVDVSTIRRAVRHGHAPAGINLIQDAGRPGDQVQGKQSQVVPEVNLLPDETAKGCLAIVVQDLNAGPKAPVDRLSRSMALFERRGVSFVSVT